MIIDILLIILNIIILLFMLLKSFNFIFYFIII